MNEIKPKIITSKDKSYVIVEYIYNNPRCSKSELNNSLSHDYEKNIMRAMTRETLNNNVKYLLKMKHIISLENKKHGNKEYPNIFVVNIEKLKYYPEIWNKKQIELKNYKIDKDKHYEMLRFYVDDDILKRAINSHTKIEILSKGTNFYFSDDMNELFNDFIYSTLIECFLNNPDHWLTIKKPEDLQFKINIEANWNEDPEILKRLIKRKEKSLRENYLYPFGSTKFHKWGNENNEPTRKERIANKTEEDLFNKAFTENQLRKEKIEKYKQKVLQLKTVYLAVVDKEYEDISSGISGGFEENIIAIKKLRKLIENEYIDFQEDVVLHWSDMGRVMLDDRQSLLYHKVINMVKYDKVLNEEDKGEDREEKWRREWERIRSYGDYKSKTIDMKKKTFIPHFTFEDIVEEIRRRYPGKIEKIEEIIDSEFNYNSIRSIMNNKDYFKSEVKKTKLCLECGKEHSEYHAYCKECMIEIRKKNKYVKTCSECGKVHEERYSYCKDCWDKMTKICPSCGREHIEYGKYCYSCSVKSLEENEKNK